MNYEKIISNLKGVIHQEKAKLQKNNSSNFNKIISDLEEAIRKKKRLTYKGHRKGSFFFSDLLKKHKKSN